VFNDWLDDDGSVGDNSTQITGRTTFLPYLSEDENTLLHLGFALRYDNSKESIRFSSSPELTQAPLFVDSGEIKADSTYTYSFEASWQQGPFWLSGEYVKTSVEADYLQNPELSGYHVSAVLSLTGEMREYNKRSGTFSPVSVARTVEQNGFGAVEVSTRWSVFNGNDGGLNSGDSQIFSLGLAWWLTPKFNVNFNYRWVTLDRCSFISDACNLTGKSDGFNTRILLIL